ncbi:MAG: hypothetical protein HRU38_25940 [Saccharospirillaceae bacterium]|nr:hypothetical protein [Saccharospirillaceae bacterium]
MLNQSEFVQKILNILDPEIENSWSAIVIRCEIDEDQSRKSMQYFTTTDKSSEKNISYIPNLDDILRQLKYSLLGSKDITAFQLIISRKGKYEIKNYFHEIDWEDLDLGFEVDYQLIENYLTS